MGTIRNEILLDVEKVISGGGRRVFFNSYYRPPFTTMFFVVGKEDITKCIGILRDRDFAVKELADSYVATYESKTAELYIQFYYEYGRYEVFSIGHMHFLSTFYEWMRPYDEQHKNVGSIDLRISQYNMTIKKELQRSQKRIGIDNYQTNIPELYPKINVNVMLDAFLESRENILVLTGDPGTGKTTLIKMILCEMAKRKMADGLHAMDVAYIKDQKVLREQITWTALHEQDFPVIVLDDLDNALMPRKTIIDENTDIDKIEHDNMFVNQLLSFSDGIFEPNTKIIITTNQSLDSIDKALLRPGRCFDIINMVALSNDEARHIWTTIYDLPVGKFHEKFGDTNDVTQAQLVSYKNHVGFIDNNSSYLKDDSISSKRHFLAGTPVKQNIGFV